MIRIEGQEDINGDELPLYTPDPEEPSINVGENRPNFLDVKLK